MTSAPSIGVVSLQGDVREHRGVLESLGAEVKEIRRPDQLDAVEGLVFPGGESTTMSMLLSSSGLMEAIAERLENGMPVFGTCAGMILLAATVLDGRPDQKSFGAIDIAVRRNAFGRQLDSFEADLDVQGLSGGPMHAAFIRAPIVDSVGNGVDVLASVAMGDVMRPVVCRSGRVTVAAFHPEITGDARLHALLLADVLEVRQEQQ